MQRNDLITAGVVTMGGIVAGFSLAAVAHRLWLPALIPADCSAVGEKSGVVAGVPYLERMRGHASPDESVPMVVLFHSKGASPSGHSGMLSGIGPARLILPEGAYEGSGGRVWWQRGIKDAMDPAQRDAATAQWEGAAERMAEFLRQIVQCRPTVGKPVITGSSQGGEMTLLMASTHPELVSAGVAVSSYLLPDLWTKRMAPVHMIHGTGDKTVPYDWAREYFETMQARGAPLSFESYSSPGHSVTSPMSDDWITAVRELVARERPVA